MEFKEKASFPKTYEEISGMVEELYHSGVACMNVAGTDTQYAPIRHALEYLLGMQENITRLGPNEGAIEGSERIRFSEETMYEMLSIYKIVVAALEWALWLRRDTELFKEFED